MGHQGRPSTLEKEASKKVNASGVVITKAQIFTTTDQTKQPKPPTTRSK
jgi:hypothetical protein